MLHNALLIARQLAEVAADAFGHRSLSNLGRYVRWQAAHLRADLLA